MVRFAKSKSAGFTLVEVLVVMSIVALLGGLGLFLSFDTYRSSNFTTGVDAIVVSLQRTRSRAVNNIDASPHGVKIVAGSYTIFKGSVYNPADPSNEVINGNSNFTFTGPTEIVFEQLSGKTDDDGDLVITDGAKTSTISINAQGRIN